MRRTQIDFFFTPNELGEALAEVVPAHGATIIGAVRDSEPRGFRAIPPDTVADFLGRHDLRSLFVALGSVAPGQNVGDLIGGQRYMTISLGRVDEEKRTVDLSTAIGNPDSPVGPLFEDFKEAVKRRSHKGVIRRDDPKKRVQPIFWARALEGWKFPGYKPVVPAGKNAGERATHARKEKAAK